MRKIYTLIISMSLLSGCATTRFVQTIEHSKELHHSFNDHLSLVITKAYKVVKGDRYYYEAVRRTSLDKKIDLFSEYYFLAKDYVLAGEAEDLNSLVKEEFEDRVVHYGDVQIEKHQKNTMSVLPFEIDGAKCMHYHKYIFLPYRPVPDIIGQSETTQYLGDAESKGYLCDYSKKMSQSDMKAFFLSLKTINVDLSYQNSTRKDEK